MGYVEDYIEACDYSLMHGAVVQELSRPGHSEEIILTTCTSLAKLCIMQYVWQCDKEKGQALEVIGENTVVTTRYNCSKTLPV